MGGSRLRAGRSSVRWVAAASAGWHARCWGPAGCGGARKVAVGGAGGSRSPEGWLAFVYLGLAGPGHNWSVFDIGSGPSKALLTRALG